jgi:hypothetical protein
MRNQEVHSMSRMSSDESAGGVRMLLLSGAVAGPLFVLVVLVQSYLVPGFNPRLDPLSLLSLGPWGFIQITNFILAGVLNIAYAAGLWRTLHGGPSGTFAPILIAIYGLGLITVGIFTDDPAYGFPPGSVATHTSWHGLIHDVGGLFVFVSVAAALAVFVRVFLARRAYLWAGYSAGSSLLVLILFVFGTSSPTLMARFLFLGVLVGWMGSSVVAMKLLATDGPQATHASQSMEVTR